jgi:hypothetical protein
MFWHEVNDVTEDKLTWSSAHKILPLVKRKNLTAKSVTVLIENKFYLS